ncbi:MAG: MiaB/RimO family radical SAM methylthiotransferase [Candidatus Omnitrophica bacterium]|nr:MiaB/RimO family radical SAM methylthiotransferase [Candidatus Omnitrophota bacterium]
MTKIQMAKKTFSIISLGCFRNTYDSEVIIKRFQNKGYRYVCEASQALDLMIINTCGFIEEAKKESLTLIREALSLKRKGRIKRILVSGCLSQRYRNELRKSLPQVDEFKGVEEFEIGFESGLKLTTKNSAFVKISEGCINCCSFCAIPLIKGSLKSRPSKDIIREVRFLNDRGVKEINIIGQDITSWGKDLGKSRGFSRLLASIEEAADKVSWIRLIYTHPKHFSSELIEMIGKSAKICNYIDLPIQHINDKILKSMNRGISSDKLISLIKKIRKTIPKVALRSSIIVGFPGENNKDFQELKDFLKFIKFERLGVFVYSREEGTRAYDFVPQVHPATKKKRQRLLMEQQKDIVAEFNKGLLDKKISVLIEERQNSTFIGRSEYDAPEVDGQVFVKRKGLKIGHIYQLKITDYFGYDLIAE